ncbi:MAG: DNA cytosine methyltransferase [Thermofilaceae archaeon]
MTCFKVVSLFSGAGGLDWGFREAGFEVVFANDVLEAPMRTYSRNFGLRLSYCHGGKQHTASAGEALVCDVSLVDFSELADLGVDAVVGGPPCQDFSVVRGPEWDRRGIEVRRGRLYAHFVRALVQLQPKVFVFENVPGLVSSNRGLAYRTILDDLANLNLRWDEVRRSAGIGNGTRSAQGYEVVFSGVVDFSRLGVPQKRERLIVIGVRRDLAVDRKAVASVKEVLLSSGVFSKFPLTPIEVFEGKVLPDLQDEYRGVMRKWSGVWLEVGTLRALEWKKEVWDRLTFDAVKDYLTANGIALATEVELEEAWRAHKRALEELGYLGVRVCSKPLPDGTCLLPEDAPEVRERMKRIPPGENHEFVRGTRWEVEGRGISLVYRRIHPLKPSYTVVAYGGGGTHGYHYERDRATMSLRERARLQTFPDTFLFSGSRTEIRAQIGEAVPALAAKRIAEAVLQLLRLTD